MSHMGRLIRWMVAVSFAASSAFSPSASAQPPAISGLAKDASTGAPLECLHVALVDTTNRAVAHTVTDASGTFVLVAPGPGTFRVRFEIFGWESLFGPLDTLAEGALRERAYPLTFANSLMPDDTSAFKISRQLRQREDTTWRSADQKPSRTGLRYPDRWLRREGSARVVEEYIVNADGQIRPGSLRTIEATHQDFADVVRKALPNLRYQAATQGGAPVCQLARARVNFANKDRGLRILLTD
jgi:hypothetical protein